ncbi:MAG: glycosyltransferase [Anaerolineae bacterium]|nr:glycosyltransferase [Anaerolineae bacterium]
MKIDHLAILSVHTSPLARLGGEKTGGMNVYVRELARELGRRGIHVDVFTRHSSPDDLHIDTSLGSNVRVITIQAGPHEVLSPDETYPYVQEFAAGVIAFSTLHNLRYDLIYSHYWLSGCVAITLKEIWGIPFVQMFHTLGHMKNRVALKPNVPTLPDLRVSQESRIIRLADRIVAATPAEHAQLLWLYRADRRKIVIIPPGVNGEQFFPQPMEESRTRLGLETDQTIFLFVGRIEPLKGVDTILRAFASIKRESPGLLAKSRFLVIGGDPGQPNAELARLIQRTRELHLESVVDFLGAKDQNHLRDYYAASNAVIMPSEYESFGMVALEAMACGTPVIASHVGGLAFLIQDGDNGYLIPVGEPNALSDKLIQILINPESVSAMRMKAAVAARQYTWSAIAEQLEAIFERIGLSSARRHPP